MAITDLKDVGKWTPGSKVRRYEVDWYDAKGKRKRKRFQSKADALDFDASVRLDVGGVRDRSKASRLSLDEAFEKWVEYLSVYGGRSNDGASPSTLGGYRSIHAQWVAPELGGVYLGKLDRETVEEWRLSMTSRDGREPSPRQRGVADDQLVRLLNWCMDQGWLGENPAKTLSGARAPRPKSRKKKPHVYLSTRQVWRLAAFAPDATTRNIILVMASTGLRFGEVAALRVEDFDPDTGEIVVNKALALDHGKVYGTRTKSHEDRSVYIDDWVRALIAEAVEGRGDRERIFTTEQGRDLNRDNWADRKFGKAASRACSAIADLQSELGVSERKKGVAFFGPKTAKALKERSQSQSLQDVLRTPGEWIEPQFDHAVKVIATSDGGGFQVLKPGDVDFKKPTPHDMRHTAASHLIRQGTDVKTVQSQLGHADAGTTLNTYAGVWDDAKVEAGRVLASALARPE